MNDLDRLVEWMKKDIWSKEEHEMWSWLGALVGSTAALAWLMTNSWFFGLLALACFTTAYRSWLKAGRL